MHMVFDSLILPLYDIMAVLSLHFAAQVRKQYVCKNSFKLRQTFYYFQVSSWIPKAEFF